MVYCVNAYDRINGVYSANAHVRTNRFYCVNAYGRINRVYCANAHVRTNVFYCVNEQDRTGQTGPIVEDEKDWAQHRALRDTI